MTPFIKQLFPDLTREERERRAKIFHVINTCQIVTVCVLAVTASFTLGGSGPLYTVVGPCAVLVVLLVIAGRIVRRGTSYYRGVLLSVGSVNLILIFMIVLLGARDPVVFLLTWVVLIVGVLFEAKWGYVAAALMSLILFFFRVTELYQWIPMPVLRRDHIYSPYWTDLSTPGLIESLVSDNVVMATVFFMTAFVIWMVSASLRRSLDNTKEIVSQLQSWATDNLALATRITNASTEIDATIQQQKTGASQQAVTVEIIAGSVRTLLDGARKIAERSTVVADNAGKSLEHNDRIVERIKTLADQTRRITEILHVMKRIANKSDLLALNAALEGVKAGTRGRGFVLVASEVRRLAEDVLSSVRDIRDLTEDIGEATNAVKGSSLDGAELAERTAELTQEISLITRQQEEGTEMLDEAIQSIAEIAVQTAAASGQVADSAKTLGDLAENIRELARQRETIGRSAS